MVVASVDPMFLLTLQGFFCVWYSEYCWSYLQQWTHHPAEEKEIFIVLLSRAQKLQKKSKPELKKCQVSSLPEVGHCVLKPYILMLWPRGEDVAFHLLSIETSGNNWIFLLAETESITTASLLILRMHLKHTGKFSSFFIQTNLFKRLFGHNQPNKVKWLRSL